METLVHVYHVHFDKGLLFTIVFNLKKFWSVKQWIYLFGNSCCLRQARSWSEIITRHTCVAISLWQWTGRRFFIMLAMIMQADCEWGMKPHVSIIICNRGFSQLYIFCHLVRCVVRIICLLNIGKMRIALTQNRSNQRTI